MSKKGVENLIAAVAKAMGRKKLDIDSFDDRLMIQKGCFILNLRGVGPAYNFSMYIRGPYSRDLADDYFKVPKKRMSYETDVPEDDIAELSRIMDKGAPFVEAYTTIVLVSKYNRMMKEDELTDFVAKLKPHIEKETIREASEYRKIVASAT